MEVSAIVVCLVVSAWVENAPAVGLSGWAGELGADGQCCWLEAVLRLAGPLVKLKGVDERPVMVSRNSASAMLPLRVCERVLGLPCVTPAVWAVPVLPSRLAGPPRLPATDARSSSRLSVRGFGAAGGEGSSQERLVGWSVSTVRPRRVQLVQRRIACRAYGVIQFLNFLPIGVNQGDDPAAWSGHYAHATCKISGTSSSGTSFPAPFISPLTPILIK